MKRLVILFLVYTIFYSTIPYAQAYIPPSLSGIQFYPADHIWNVPVDTLPVHPMSDAYINSANSSAYLYIYRGQFVNIVNSSQPKQYFTHIRYESQSDDVPYPIPENALVETESLDRGMNIIDSDSNLYYQIYDAVKAPDGTWSCGSAAVFDLSSYALRKDGSTSDAAGLSGFPGIIRYEEVASGEINHALRINPWQTQNKHVWPARHDAGIANPAYTPMGQRFRLKASVDISEYTPQQQVILKAMKKYGMMVADNTGNPNTWTLSAMTDSRWDYDYATFSGIKGSDFEAVDVSSLMIDKDSGQARIDPNSIQSTTITPLIAVTSPNGGETWKRGTSNVVTWSYTGSPGSNVEIVLLKGGTEVGTIADSVPIGSSGKGSYTWPISWYGTTGSDYKVSVQSISQPTIKDTSNNYFTIASGTTPPAPPAQQENTIPVMAISVTCIAFVIICGVWVFLKK